MLKYLNWGECFFFRITTYPKAIFDKVYRKFVEKKDIPSANDNTNSSIDYSGVTFSVPYIGESSYKFSKQIIGLFKSKYNINVLPVFTTSKVGDYFSLKCRTPRNLTPNVVYKFSCLQDANITYIGQSKRHLVTRVGEHTSLHKLEPKSAIKEHICVCNSCQ